MADESLTRLQAEIRRFAAVRSWESVNTGKNLAMALNVEAGELLELFQWLSPAESDRFGSHLQRERVEEEVADVFIYLLQLADRLDIDLLQAGFAKMEQNAHKYPPPAE